MTQLAANASPSKLARWGSYVLSALPVLMMTMSGVMKLVQPPMIVEGFAKNGIAASTVTIIGIIELLCAALYVIPKTAILGAILVTGYLGGAVFVHVQKGEIALLSPLLLGVFAWGGLYLRDKRIAALIPLRSRPE